MEIFILIAIAGVCAGALAYHFSALAGLKTEVASLSKIIEGKDATINKQAADIGTFTASKAALEIANDNFVKLAAAQNRSIANIRKERDDAMDKWNTAVKLAAQNSALYRQSIDKVMETQLKPGQTWCDGFSDLINDLIAKRKGQK